VAPSDCPSTDPVQVWDRLWSHAPSTARDDQLIERERQGVRWTLVARKLEEAFGQVAGLRTIELGSGRGDLSVLLAEQGAQVTLLDASEQALAQARNRFGRRGLAAEFLQDDLLAPEPGWEGRFDVALSSGVVEHFRGEVRTDALAAHWRALRPGGLAIISVPHAHCPPYRLWKLYLELRGWWPYGLEIPYTRRELVKRARQAGFREAETTAVGLWQSVTDHLWRGLLGGAAGPPGRDWAGRASVLDPVMGLSAILLARR
jgi:2-polyprenyl-3-methyl-5-hydroxy-6-metoxy-1,4-benzoquinol methylase